MNYQKIYDSLIAKRQQNPAIKTGPRTVAKHHILPKSMGGSNDKSNLVVLTNKEHFVAHHLLWKIYQNDSMAYAFSLMCFMSDQKISAKVYQKLMEEYGKRVSKRMKGNKFWLGKKHKKETIKKMKESAKHAKHYPLKESTKLKLSQKLKGRKLSVEHLEKMRIANLGDKNHMFGKRFVHNILTNENLKLDKNAPLPEGYAEHRAFVKRRKLSKPRCDKGKKHNAFYSKEAREKIAAAKRGKKLSNEHKQKIREGAKRPEKWIKKLSNYYKDVDFIGFEVENYMKMTHYQRHVYLMNWIKTHPKSDII